LRVRIYLTRDEYARSGTEAPVCVVIDVLRATSSIVTALAHGCAAVVPVAEVPRARALGAERAWLVAGERNGVKLPGFHFGNSPREMTSPQLRGKTLVITTTNGTATIMTGSRAKLCLVASLLNLSSTAEAVLAAGGEVAVVCSGTEGRFSLDDYYVACALTTLLTSCLEPSGKAARRARFILQRYPDPLEALRASAHGQRLQRLGFGEDLVWCARVDAFPVVARWNRGAVVASRQSPASGTARLLRSMPGAAKGRAAGRRQSWPPDFRPALHPVAFPAPVVAPYCCP